LVIALALAWLSGGFCLALLGLVLHGLWTRWRLGQERRRRQALSLQVVARHDLTDELFTLRLENTRRSRLPGFLPGQYLALLAPAGPDNRLLRRCYSLSCWSPRPRYYELCIKREDEGRMSRFLHSSLQLGATLTALPPTGPFHLRRPDTPAVVLMAGGVGITPMRAMLHALLARHGKTQIWLFHSSRHANGLAYADEFQRLATLHTQFHYRPMLSQPPAGWKGDSGRLDSAHVLNALLGQQATYYQCASASFMHDMRAGLVAAGVPDATIHEEAFGLAAEGADPQTMWFEGRACAYLGEPSLLLSLEGQGQSIPSECRTGHCGSCRLTLKEGQVRWQAEAGCTVANDEILACLCVPVSTVTLEWPR
jgi:ferredoxin-NADP reductase